MVLIICDKTDTLTYDDEKIYLQTNKIKDDELPHVCRASSY